MIPFDLKHVLRFACLALAVGLNQAAEPVFGSVDFRPTPEHPFGFRGDGSGQFPGASPLTEWSEKTGLNIRWSVPIGKSFASPILTGKDVIVTAEPNLLLCLDCTNGNIRWKLEIAPALLTQIDEKKRQIAAEYEPPKDGAGMMAATPITDGKAVYVVLANGMVLAIDLNGKTLWNAFIDAEQNTGYGRSASPILCSGKLIVHMTNLYAFDATTGKQLWMNAEAPSVYGTPTAVKIDGVELIITGGGDVVRVSDGKLLASGIGAALHTTPVMSNGTLYYGERALNAVHLTAAGKAKELWTAAITNEVFGSPLLHDGVLFTATGKGELYAFDQNAKGELTPLIDARKLFGESESNTPIAYSSLTQAGNFVFYTSNAGVTIVFEPTREAKQIAKNVLPSGCGASPVFAGREMYMRTNDKLYCIGPRQ